MVSGLADENGFYEYKRLILAELERLDESIKSLSAEQKNMTANMAGMRADVRELQTKASLWGGLSGVLTALSAIFLSKLKN